MERLQWWQRDRVRGIHQQLGAQHEGVGYTTSSAGFRRISSLEDLLALDNFEGVVTEQEHGPSQRAIGNVCLE